MIKLNLHNFTLKLKLTTKVASLSESPGLSHSYVKYLIRVEDKLLDNKVKSTIANNNDDRIFSCLDSESLSSLSHQCTQLSKHYNVPVVLHVGGIDTHKRKHGWQPKTEDQKMIIPQLNSTKKTLFSDTSA